MKKRHLKLLLVAVFGVVALAISDGLYWLLCPPAGFGFLRGSKLVERRNYPAGPVEVFHLDRDYQAVLTEAAAELRERGFTCTGGNIWRVPPPLSEQERVLLLGVGQGEECVAVFVLYSRNSLLKRWRYRIKRFLSSARWVIRRIIAAGPHRNVVPTKSTGPRRTTLTGTNL